MRVLGLDGFKGTVGEAFAVDQSHTAQQLILRQVTKNSCALGAFLALSVTVVDLNLQWRATEVLYELPAIDQTSEDDVDVLKVNVAAVLTAFSFVKLRVVELILTVNRQTIFLQKRKTRSC